MELQKVILIDDDTPTNIYNSLILDDIHIPESNILSFADPEKAYRFLIEEDDKREKEEDTCTAIFLDLNMPKMTGWELIEKIKQEKLKFPLHYHLGILTASLNETDQEKAENSNCIKSFIQKPLTEEKALKFLSMIN